MFLLIKLLYVICVITKKERERVQTRERERERERERDCLYPVCFSAEASFSLFFSPFFSYRVSEPLMQNRFDMVNRNDDNRRLIPSENHDAHLAADGEFIASKHRAQTRKAPESNTPPSQSRNHTTAATVTPLCSQLS